MENKKLFIKTLQAKIEETYALIAQLESALTFVKKCEYVEKVDFDKHFENSLRTVPEYVDWMGTKSTNCKVLYIRVKEGIWLSNYQITDAFFYFKRQTDAEHIDFSALSKFPDIERLVKN